MENCILIRLVEIIKGKKLLRIRIGIVAIATENSQCVSTRDSSRLPYTTAACTFPNVDDIFACCNAGFHFKSDIIRPIYVTIANSALPNKYLDSFGNRCDEETNSIGFNRTTFREPIHQLMA